MIISLFHHFLSVFINKAIKLWQSINKGISKYGPLKVDYVVLSTRREILLQSYLLMSVSSYLTEKKTQISLALPPSKALPSSVCFTKVSSHYKCNLRAFFNYCCRSSKVRLFLKKNLFSSLFVARNTRNKLTSDWVHHEEVCKAIETIKNSIFNPLCAESQHSNVEYGHATISLGRN